MTNIIDRLSRCCSIIVLKKGNLRIGNNVGMNSTAIVCHNSIKIEDYVKIGGNVVICDIDFHSLESTDRQRLEKDKLHTKTASVLL